MKPMRRAIHIDFHTMPGIHDFNERYDAEAFANTLADAGVEYVNVFARCNEGFAYYPTKIGVPYEGMKGDMLGETVSACHKKGIGVTAYMNAGYDHEQAIRHRDWTVRNPELQKSDDYILDYFIYMCYYNSPFKQYLLDMVKELCDNYDLDGIFLDCLSVNPCYCSYCMREMRKKGIDTADRAAVLEHAKESRRQFCREVKAIVGDKKRLFFNMLYNDAKGLNTHIEIEGLPGGQGYDFFLPQVSYARNVEKEILYMTARFQKSWADFGGLKTRAAMEYDVWDAFMHGCGVSLGDHMHPAENIEPHIYSMIGDVYKTVKEYEPYTYGAKYLPEIAIITDSECYINKSGRGACRMLAELKYNFDIINENMDFSRFRVLILPDSIRITPTLKEKLSLHLASGGAVISSAFSGLDKDGQGFAMPEWGLDFDGNDTNNQSYFKMRDTSDEILGNLRWSMYDQGIFMHAKDGTEILADYVKPYFNRHVSPDRGFFYTPPEAPDGHTAISKCNNVYHVCFKIFETYYKGGMYAHKQIIANILKDLIPEPLLRADALPKTSRTTVTEKDGMRFVHVKVSYPEAHGDAEVIESHNFLPAGRKIAVKGEYSSAVVVPAMTAVESKIVNGYTEITLPEIEGYVMIGLK